jgi:glutamate-1-semialdehyde 2,1-aminomutase
MVTLDRSRLGEALRAEEGRFVAEHPRSRALFERAQASLLAGVPMSWMVRVPGAFPVFVAGGEGAHFEDVDGRRYLDLCLGDTGAMTGHAPAAAVKAAAERLARGATFMLPTADAVFVGEELARRFGLPFWQVTLSATDANRFALRLARAVTGRPKVLVFNYCYHGTVDETLATLSQGSVLVRPGCLGPPFDPASTTKVVEWNDAAALEAALAPGDVACVLAEPVMTNVGIIHPEPGYHQTLRELTRRTGTLLLIDETHTICAGPGGYTREQGLEPDLLVIGKLVGGGVPAAAYGLSARVAQRVERVATVAESDTSGIGGTLAGSALSLAAMRATLEEVLTPAFYARAIPLAERFAAGVVGVIEEKRLPWILKRLGCRAEYWFSPTPPRNGSEAAAAADAELDRYMHLAALNRGILLTPFHNMALFCPAVAEADVDRHTEVFRESVTALL